MRDESRGAGLETTFHVSAQVPVLIRETDLASNRCRGSSPVGHHDPSMRRTTPYAGVFLSRCDGGKGRTRGGAQLRLAVFFAAPRLAVFFAVLRLAVFFAVLRLAVFFLASAPSPEAACMLSTRLG